MNVIEIPRPADSTSGYNYVTPASKKVLLRMTTAERVAPPALVHAFPSVEAAAESLGYTPATPAPRPSAPPPVLAVTPRQLRLQLLSVGVTMDQIDAAISAIPDPADRAAATIEWEYSLSIRSDHPLLKAVAASLGMNDEQVRSLFREAVHR